MHFLLHARELVAFPGGYGTLDELFEVLILIQTGKMQRIPLVLVGCTFWRHMIDFDLLLDESMSFHPISTCSLARTKPRKSSLPSNAFISTRQQDMNTKQRSIAESGIMMHTVDSLLDTQRAAAGGAHQCGQAATTCGAPACRHSQQQDPQRVDYADPQHERPGPAAVRHAILKYLPFRRWLRHPACRMKTGSALAELWLQQAMAAQPARSANSAAAGLQPWLETARHAWAYLFFTEHTPGERAFDERQAQVRDWYNVALLSDCSRPTALSQRRQLTLRIPPAPP
ncbi:LOG family protein [Nitrosomonas eutropha]|nr:LOG family protein [Nitrosomonas eutropha]